jgi:hypothetical protein
LLLRGAGAGLDAAVRRNPERKAPRAPRRLGDVGAVMREVALDLEGRHRGVIALVVGTAEVPLVPGFVLGEEPFVAACTVVSDHISGFVRLARQHGAACVRCTGDGAGSLSGEGDMHSHDDDVTSLSLKFADDQVWRMASPSSMDCLLRLHDYLLSLTSANVREAADFIRSAGYLAAPPMALNLASNVILAVGIRPIAISPIVALCKLLSAESCAFAPLLIRLALRQALKSHLFFLAGCLADAVFTPQCLCSAIQLLCPRQAQLPLLWFAPEIARFAPDFFRECQNFLSVSERAFISQADRIESLRRTGANPLRLAQVLRLDDPAALLALLDSGQLDLNTGVPSFLYEPFDLLSSEPTLLGYAAFFGSMKCFELLTARGASWHSFNAASVAELAIAGGHAEVISKLDRSQVTQFEVHWAVRYHRNAAYEWLCGAVDDAPNALVCCCRFNNARLLLTLKDRLTNADIAFVAACRAGWPEIAALLAGAGVCAGGFSALAAAVESGQPAAVEAVLAAGGCVSPEILGVAARGGSIEIFKRLFPLVDGAGKSNAIAIAAECGCFDICRFALGEGAVPADKTALVALFLKADQLDCYELLGEFDHSHIQEAIQCDSLGIVQCLASRGIVASNKVPIAV